MDGPTDALLLRSGVGALDLSMDSKSGWVDADQMEHSRFGVGALDLLSMDLECISNLLEFDPGLRLTSQQCLAHGFLGECREHAICAW
jgi:hypothetical protein